MPGPDSGRVAGVAANANRVPSSASIYSSELSVEIIETKRRAGTQTG